VHGLAQQDHLTIEICASVAYGQVRADAQTLEHAEVAVEPLGYKSVGFLAG